MIIASILTCCSHQKVSLTDAAAADTSTAGGQLPEGTGGATSTGGVTSTGGMTTNPDPDAGCDSATLMRKIAAGVQGVRIPGGCTANPSGTDGSVTLDTTGKITAITGIYYTDDNATNATVDALSTERWACLAGQTLRYTCANPVIGP